jgi:YXWGXW repeat-containing protein
MKKLLSIGVFALALVAADAKAAEVFVRFGPPPPPRREVVVVRPSPRHVWIPGYYRWTGHRYAWVNGYWTMPPRPHAAWVPGYWAPRRGGQVWIGGYWR